MPIYVLGGRDRPVCIPHQPLAVSMTGTVLGAELDVRADRDQPVVRLTAHQAVLPSVTGTVTVAVRPAGTPRFGAGTVIALAIAHETPDELDPVQVMFDPVDVSGDAGLVIATLQLRGAEVEIGVSAVADAPLSPLGSAARSAARQLVGRAPTRPDGSVVLAVDISASMRPWFADGSVAAVTDVVVGVAAAVGVPRVSVALVGDEVTPADAPEGDPQSLAEAVRQLRPRWSAGSRWSGLPAAPGTIACTDFPTAEMRQRFPVLALSDDRRFDPVGLRLPAPRPGSDASAELLAHPEVLGRITAGIVHALA